MLDGFSRDLSNIRPRVGRAVIGRESMVGLALLLETVIITALSMATGAAYHLFMYGEAGPLSQFLGLGLIVAALFEIPLVVHAHYRTEHGHAGRRNVMQLVNSWTYAFLCVALIALVTKTGGNISDRKSVV